MAEPPTSQAQHVFMSYASRDRARVIEIVDHLEAAGIPVWLDQRRIEGGTNYGPEVVDGIAGASALLLACSQASFSSHNVRQEVQLAWKYRRPYLPLMLEPVATPRELEYWLEGWQRISVLDQPAEAWLPAVLDALQRLKESGGVPSPVPNSPDEVAVSGSLPTPPTPLVGRTAEVAALADLLTADGAHLVTLTGPGGTGKTRLALEVGAALRSAFSDGVWFVDLAPLTDPALVLPTIAQTLSVREMAGQPLRDALVSHLTGKTILLVLDNCEQIVAAAPAVGDLLAACPELRLLATSREALRLRAEREFPLSPLPVPDARSLPPIADLERVDAVTLFVDRARAAKSSFSLTAENAAAVAEICRRLDGLPLALELAAARTKLLSPAALLERLGNRLALLVGGARDLPERQQTLRDTIAWSYDLLSPAEQALFRRLAVFSGGWTLGAAESVATAAGALDLDILDGLGSLVDKSLVRQEDTIDGEPRFSLLETLCEFGLENLEASGEAEATRRGHGEFFQALADEAEPQLFGPDQAAWLERLEIEHDNLRAAMVWSARGERALGLRLAGGLWRFWEVRGHLFEGRRWLNLALGDNAEPGTNARARALRAAGALAFRQGDYTQATQCAREALATFQQLGDRHGVATSLSNLANVALVQGDYRRAATLMDEALVLSRALGDRHSVAGLLNNLANVAFEQGDYGRAVDLADEALTLMRALGDRSGVAGLLGNLATVAFEQGDYDRAATLCDEALALSRAVGDRRRTANSLNGLGDVAEARGDFRRAAEFYAEALALMWELGDKVGTASCLEGVATVAADVGEGAGAVRLSSAAKALREAISAPVPSTDIGRNEQVLAAAQAQLGEMAFAAAWAAGQALSWEEAVEEARSWIRESAMYPASLAS